MTTNDLHLGGTREYATMRYLPAIIWAALIFFASSIPSSSLPKLAVEVSDLLIHFGVYTVFGFLLASALMSPRKIRLKLILIACGIGILYGATDEFHQRFVAGRFPSVSDFLADSAGILFGLALFVYAPRFLRFVGIRKN